MRILRLRFRNLNSLAGDWEIDLTHPAYVSSGIFAITGPTGAGKSTILDGICLALYGQTPRLCRVTQSENEIMSRQTGDCSAEVEFETGRGRFRCHWSQHRSRKQADGPLQAPKHEISDAASGKILEAKLKAVVARVEEVTGMDFERFTRSMLLAQGGFAAFLQATPDKRAPILEQITGTAIYSRISMKVHELTTEQRRKLDAMRAGLNGLQLLSPEEESELRRELAGKEQDVAVMTTVDHGIREKKAWVERIVALEAELIQAEQAWSAYLVKKNTAAPEREQLTRGRRALSLEGGYVALEGGRKQQEVEKVDLGTAVLRLPLIRQSGLDAAAHLEQVEASLLFNQEAQTNGVQVIRATRELDVKLAQARAGLKEISGEIAKLRKQGQEYDTAIIKYETELDQTGTALQALELFFVAHRTDAGLAEAFAGLEQQVKTLKVRGGQSSDCRRQLERQSAACVTGEQTLQRAELVWQDAGQDVAKAESQLGQIHVQLENLLEGRGLPVWRAEAEVFVTRLNTLQVLYDTVLRGEEGQRKVNTLTQREGNLTTLQQEFLLQEGVLAGERTLRDELVRQLREKIVLLNRVRDLESERQHLQDGYPCPLCGALEHPYALGNVPTPEEVALELERASRAAQELNEQLSGIRAQLSGVITELEQVQRERNDYLGRVVKDEAVCASLMVELELDAASGGQRDALRGETASCVESLTGHRAVISQVEQGEGAERKAKTALDKARDIVVERDKVRREAALRFENAVSERSRLERESALLGEDVDRMLADVERGLEPYGYKDVSLHNVQEVLETLLCRRHVYGERLQEKERVAAKQAELVSELGKQRVLLAQNSRTIAEREELLREKNARCNELTEKRQELFGDRNPDVEEKRLAEALKDATQRRDAAWREQNRLQAELVRLEEEIRTRTASLSVREVELAGLELATLQRMSDIGFEDETAFLQARLPEGRLEELSRLDEYLRQQDTELQTRRQDRTMALQKEREKKLTASTLQEILEESVSVAGQLSELQQGVGALDQKLRLHLEQQRLQQDRIKALELQKTECARWERLHELIGSADGKKFRNFAQGLTFELMVAHANKQLRKMSDRYMLVRDVSEPLELNVIDNYQAGEIRSTKNLSGGESFIVSLALALGLSGMASRTVRVDSLFLDEGFGTLDEDALETALETLSGLQQEGKLIGIISHVPALKERIGTQIQVEAGNGGRSSLSGPGCRRIVTGS